MPDPELETVETETTETTQSGGSSAAPTRTAAAHPALAMQQAVGNRATGEMLASQNLDQGKYAWAGGVLAKPAGRVTDLTSAFAGMGGTALKGNSMEKVVRNADSDWSKVKAKHLADEPVMRNIVDFRKRYVDGLIEELRKDPRFRDMKTRAAGSTALSSDYDITFMGTVGATAVVEFNRKFREHWGKEAGTVFDTNVYAEDVLPDKNTVVSGKDDITKLGATAGRDNVDARLDEGLQDVSSLVKVRKNMTRAAWAAFTDRILASLAGIPGDTAAYTEARARFTQVNTIYERTYVQQIIGQLGATKDGKKRLLSLQKKGKTNIAIVEDIMGDDQGIEASNRVYEQKLLYAADLERRRAAADPTSPQWKTLTVDLRKAKADAMLFANEPYFSAGTLYHVVGNTQAKFGATLGSAALFQSLQENYGDTLKELHHLHAKPWKTVAIKSSKYVWRMLDAAVSLRGTGVTIGGKLDELRDAMKVALDVRQGAGSGTPETALAALQAVGLSDTRTLEEQLAKIAADANLAFRSSPKKKAGEDDAGEAEGEDEAAPQGT